MIVSVITCACHRPEAWKLCELYMGRQTRKPDQWIVLDDDTEPTVCTMGQEYIYLPHARGKLSLNIKIAEAIKSGLIKGDLIVVIENDDWYAPDYIEWCVKQLETYDLVGEGRCLYYNVAHRWWFEHFNMEGTLQPHASLCSTAFKRDLLPMLLKICQGSPDAFIDHRLWASMHGKKRVFDPNIDKRRCVGIKQMPGTVGYSLAHKGRDRNAKDDLDMAKLISLIGTEVSLYQEFWIKYEKPLNLKVPIHTETGRAYGSKWMKWFGHMTDKPGLVGLEIGTFLGDSAEFLCENVFTGDGCEYHCVDPFTGNVEHIKDGVSGPDTEASARARLGPMKQIRFHKGFSQDVLPTWTGKQLDFVFVDGEHTSQAVLRDCVMAFEHLKVGGLMLIDDYLWEVMPRPTDRPKTGVDGFLSAYADYLEQIPPGGWQILIKRIK